MGIYNFKTEDVFRFANSIGAKTHKRGDELVFNKCPYCRPDDKDTFSINLRTGQFECKRGSCGTKGNMITLSRDFDFSLGREADAYYATVDYSTRQYKKFRDAHKQIETKDAAIMYMQTRGINAEITRKYELTTLNGKENVLVFPFKDQDGNLVYIKYRDMMHTKESKSSKEWCESNCKPILFGMNHCAEDAKTLVITEGQIDSLSCTQAGIENAVSVPTGKNGFTWIPYCWDWINRFEKIVVFGDCENGIITLADELKKRWELKVSVVRPEDYRGCKDANEILQKYGAEAVRFAVNNAVSPNIDCIKPLASVKYVDLMSMPMFKTNMPTLDDLFDGGLRFGQFAVLTGKRGDGKSTFASQLGVEALAQDYNCFFYSGELPDFHFRNWMDRQITKKKEPTQSDLDKVNQWYGEKAYIYDNTCVSDENSDLLKAIEIAIIQKNCKFILVDNLMTAMEFDENSDLYKMQSAFCGNLAALAKKYTVFILLIAHPRKTNLGIDNDDVAGSSNITDRADIVMTYSRINSKENHDDSKRRFEVLKNRLTGKRATGDEGIELVYDAGSKGIAEKTDAFFTRNYGWNNEDPYDGFVSVTDDMEIPFD